MSDLAKALIFVVAVAIIALVAFFITKTVEIFEEHPNTVSFIFGFITGAIIVGLVWLGISLWRRYKETH